MKKRKTYQIIALTLALLMFVTSVGFSVDIHYCQDEIQSFSFTGKAKSCHEMEEHHCDSRSDKKDQSCHSSDEESSCEKDCCHNEQLAQDNLKNEAVNTAVEFTEVVFPNFLFAFISVFLTDNKAVYYSAELFEHYTPPLVLWDIQSLFQIFLN